MILKDFAKRFFTSIILLPIVYFAITFDRNLFILLVVTVGIICFKEWYFINKKKITFISLLGFVFIFLSMISTYYLRGQSLNDIYIFLWIVSICIMSDIGGYFFGKIFKGKKLIKISPNKTYSGATGSLFLSLFPIFIINSLNVNFLNLSLSITTIFISIGLSIVCQFGDIIVSYFKRLNNLKDSGNILPGHGGLLDRVDGLLFVMICAAFLKINNII